jgi:hypothetical protein
MSDVKNTQNISITGSSDISIGDIQNVASVEQSASTTDEEIIKAFASLMQKVNSLPESSDKNDARSAVKALEAEASKGDGAQEKTVRKWINFLLDTAPDIWQVAIDTFIHPIKGLSTVFQKVAERAKAENTTAKSTG